MLLRHTCALALLGAAAAAWGDELACEQKCIEAGHCCEGVGSSNGKPSCMMGCLAGASAAGTTEAICNSTCTAAVKSADRRFAGGQVDLSQCDYHVPGTNMTWYMCGGCVPEQTPAWWPASVQPTAKGNDPGWWPPGYSVGQCHSGGIDNDPAGECKLGCLFTHRPSLKPAPQPKPQPPAPRAPAPLCGVFPSADPTPDIPYAHSGCTTGAELNFSNVFADHAVLQMAPAKAAVYGYVGAGGRASHTVAAGDAARVSVTVSDDGHSNDAYAVDAVVDPHTGGWKALLRPTAAGGSFTITAECVAGCSGKAVLHDVTFGAVWFCAGQSNMALGLQHTYARNSTIKAIKNAAGGMGSDIRVTGLKGNMNIDQQWMKVADLVGEPSNATMPAYGEVPLDHFASTCLYFGISLYQGLSSPLRPLQSGDKAAPIPVGLVHTAWGGSGVESWLPYDEIAHCRAGAIGDYDGVLHDTNVLPYLNMTFEGWTWYQGEANTGGADAHIHGNAGTASQPASGYACMMIRLVELWRRLWSVEPNTTDPVAPFGLVSLSPGEGPDLGSFRWAQQGSYGTVPNARMPRTFMAHAYDLRDPWSVNSGACVQQPDLMPGYDCRTPWYMGAQIHPRLKLPVGQRLALGALQVAHGHGGGTAGGVIRGCSGAGSTLSLRFDVPAGRHLSVRSYNRSNPLLSAAAVQVNGTGADVGTWVPVHLHLGSAPGTIELELPTDTVSDAKYVTAVRYAWGSTANAGVGMRANDIDCCEGNGNENPCMPMQCPIVATEPLAPWGGLPVDPFLAKVVGGNCLCPEPQVCDK